jgi:hypothetical protein
MSLIGISLAALLAIQPAIRDSPQAPAPPPVSGPEAPRKLLILISVRAVVPEPQTDPSYFGVVGVDDAGRPLEGAHRYRVHLERDDVPPKDALWSLLALETDPFSPGAHAQGGMLGHRDQLRYNDDRSLDVYLQRKPSLSMRGRNWLRTPAGRFNLVANVRWPGATEPSAEWKLPCVERLD